MLGRWNKKIKAVHAMALQSEVSKTSVSQRVSTTPALEHLPGRRFNIAANSTSLSGFSRNHCLLNGPFISPSLFPHPNLPPSYLSIPLPPHRVIPEPVPLPCPSCRSSPVQVTPYTKVAGPASSLRGWLGCCSGKMASDSTARERGNLWGRNVSHIIQKVGITTFPWDFGRTVFGPLAAETQHVIIWSFRFAWEAVVPRGAPL